MKKATEVKWPINNILEKEMYIYKYTYSLVVVSRWFTVRHREDSMTMTRQKNVLLNQWTKTEEREKKKEKGMRQF